MRIFLLFVLICRGALATPVGKASPPGGTDDVYRQLLRLTRSMELIRSNYVDAERADYESLIRGALEGMVRTLDENSQFLDSDAASRFLEDAAGEFAGLGLVVAMRDERLVIIAPMDDTPAFRAGLLPGDHILEIDGETTEGLSLDAAVTRMRGTQGSKVRLRVQRVGRTAPDQVDLVRDAIPVTSVRASMPDPDGIGYIRILQFSENTADSLLSNLERLEKGNLRALILDLRNNPGGLLQSAVEVSQLFLPSGKLIVSTEGRESPVRAVSHPTTRSRDYPLAILVNEGSASASEIVAGALQDHGRAVLVGRKTFGKGSVQSVLPVSGGSVLKLTTAWYYTPSRRRIHGFGIEPDIVVSMPPEELFAIFSVQEETVDSVGVRIEADVQRVRAADALRGVLRLHGRGDTGRAGAIGRVSAITQRIKASFPPASSQWTTQGHSYG